LRVDAVHVVALFIRNHLQRQFIVISQKNAPLTVLSDRRSLLQDINDREAILRVHGHKQARHEREVKIHVTFVTRAEVGRRVFRPLVRFGQYETVLERAIDVTSQLLEKRMRLRQIFTIGSFSLIKVRYGV
jgi:hypothetical protein